ncbi:MAG: BLUF domain-containing protein [Ginsengibacter sp.]
MIYHLVYVSSAVGPITKAGFSDILSTSRFNNKLKDITGILLYYEGNIMQVLEGEEESVMKLYNKIKLDSRHHITRMVSTKSAQRSFPDWPMSFKMLTAFEWVAYAGSLESNTSRLLFKLKNTSLETDTMVNSLMPAANFTPSWIRA